MACASGRGTDWGARSIIQEVGCGKDGFNRHVFSIFSATVADLPVNPSIFPARNPATPFLLQPPPVGRRPESLAQDCSELSGFCSRPEQLCPHRTAVPHRLRKFVSP